MTGMMTSSYCLPVYFVRVPIVAAPLTQLLPDGITDNVFPDIVARLVEIHPPEHEGNRLQSIVAAIVACARIAGGDVSPVSLHTSIGLHTDYHLRTHSQS